jgi:hypothetical protein
MGEIVFTIEVNEHLIQLAHRLHHKKYFALKVNAQNYVNKIYDDVQSKLESKPHKQTPNRLKKHGEHYANFKVSKKTTWYVFFDRKDDRFLVKFITNNHMPKGARLKEL